jgi:tetratricopeptide (TPR) repeat protein
MSYFERSIRINPNDSKARLVFAKIKVRLNDLQGAETEIRQSLTRWPDNAQFHALLSFILLKKGEYDNALKEAWKSLVIDSEFIDVSRVIAEAYRRIGYTDKSISHWESYTSIYKNDLEGHLALIELYSITGETEKLYKTIAKAMFLKGSKSWRELMKEYTGELAAHAYEPDPELLLGIIKISILNGL